MTIDEAHIIRKVWGVWLEYVYGRLNSLFIGSGGIPESLLPYPKEKLLKALRLLERGYQEAGDERAVMLIRDSLLTVSTRFISDEEAITAAGKNFSNPEWRKQIVPTFVEFRDEWVEIVEGQKGAAFQKDSSAFQALLHHCLNHFAKTKTLIGGFKKLDKEIWALRFVHLIYWMFEIFPQEIETRIVEVEKKFNETLKKIDREELITEIRPLLSEYFGKHVLTENGLQYTRENFAEIIAEQISKIAFRVTDGRLAGEYHDSIMEFTMTLFQSDRKVFELQDDSLTSDEYKTIHDSINEQALLTRKAAEEFIEELL